MKNAAENIICLMFGGVVFLIWAVMCISVYDRTGVGFTINDFIMYIIVGGAVVGTLCERIFNIILRPKKVRKKSLKICVDSTKKVC